MRYESFDIVTATIFEDVGSLLLLSILLQSSSPVTALPLPLFYVLLSIFLLFMYWFIPRLQKYLTRYVRKETGPSFQYELRVVFTLLIGVVIVFELLGLHPIIAGFFAGLVLSSSIRTETLKEKLRTLSYGLFIPIFFIVICNGDYFSSKIG